MGEGGAGQHRKQKRERERERERERKRESQRESRPQTTLQFHVTRKRGAPRRRVRPYAPKQSKAKRERDRGAQREREVRRKKERKKERKTETAQKPKKQKTPKQPFTNGSPKIPNSELRLLAQTSPSKKQSSRSAQDQEELPCGGSLRKVFGGFFTSSGGGESPRSTC